VLLNFVVLFRIKNTHNTKGNVTRKNWSSDGCTHFLNFIRTLY